MTRADARERIAKLRKEIDRYRYEYHVLDKLEISEAALDALKHELYTLEQQEPDLITPDSPTQRVAGKPAAGFRKVTHAVPMLSIEDVFTAEEFGAWYERIGKLMGKPSFDVFCMVKLDGLAVSLVYEDGLLAVGATRGDGRVGEDVTTNIRTVEAIPLRLREPRGGLPKRVEVRGEVFMAKSTLEKLNKELKKKGEPLLANPRNAAAGSIRQLDPAMTASRHLDFFAWDLVSDLGQKTHDEEWAILRELGFKTQKDGRACSSVADVEKFWRALQEKRDQLDYWIDGTVIRVNDNAAFARLGVVGKTPRGMTAWKFPAEQGTTIVREIHVSVGRTGVLTPVAVMDPVSLMGTTVTHASLHNEDEIERLGLKIGDTVIVEKAGDVIPKVIKVLPNLRTGKEKAFHMPKKCPMCGSPVARREGEVATVCTNRGCFAQQLARLLHVAAAFDMRGIGEKIAEQMLQRGLVHEPADLFTLTPGDLLTLEGFADVSANKLTKEIADHARIPLDRFLNALGIQHVGEETAAVLARAFGNIEAFRKATKEELLEVEGIGEVVADAVLAYLQDKHHEKEVDHLLKHVAVSSVSRREKSGPLAGTSWVLTGTLQSLGRDEAKDKIRALGGDVSESVSKKTSFVVVGAEPGSKFNKAKKLGVTILDEKEFLKRLSG